MIRAIRYRDHRAFSDCKIPGAVFFDVTADPLRMWFYCPCGCGEVGRLPVRRPAVPHAIPAWTWNGSLNDPALEPAVYIPTCGWHGHLRDGYWEAE